MNLLRLTTSTLPLLVVATACTSPGGSTEPTDRPPIAVSVGDIRTADFSLQHEAGGIVRAQATAEVASRVMATVAAVHVRAGDRVRRGDALITLDRRDRRAESDRAAAGVTAAREAMLAAEAEVRAATAALTLADLTHKRMASLHERRSATTQELDRATAGRRTAEAGVEAAEARLRAARATFEAAGSGAAAADVALSDTDIVAPFDGVVTERRVDPGTLATPGLPLLRLDRAGGLRLEADIDESRAAHLAVGQPVDVRLDARSDAWMAAAIAEIARIDPLSHAVLVKADLPLDTTAPSGAFGRLRFRGQPRTGLGVPASAVVRRAQLTFVYLVDADGRARLRPVSLGLSSRDVTEVLAGLREGDRVVLAPPPALTDGARVTPEGATR